MGMPLGVSRWLLCPLLVSVAEASPLNCTVPGLWGFVHASYAAVFTVPARRTAYQSMGEERFGDGAWMWSAGRVAAEMGDVEQGRES